MNRSIIVALAASFFIAPITHAAEPATAATRAEQVQALAEAPMSDSRDEIFATHGFLATRSDPIIRSSDGGAVWDLSAFSFLKGTAPDTVNPSLWRHARLMAMNGLFQVSDRIWQVRGFDLANATFVQGGSGWIIIDTLGSVETARAALDLVTQQLGSRPIVAVIYTHPHADHFGGAAGMITSEDGRSGRVQVIAPKGFLDAAVSENVIAGPAMRRRAIYQFGIPLPASAMGKVNSGIGMGVATGTASLIAPNREIDPAGETLIIDGVRMTFQFTRSTEAPVEMNIDFPDWHIVDMAENANATQHNILTPRGALVRDAKIWADDLTQALDRFGDSEVLITSHGWPRFGAENIRDYLAKQRDYYAYLHDQTVRLMNNGLTGDEIASTLTLPASLSREWYDRPYYGSLSFNSRAVYQFYMGWYDANPVHLAARTPSEAGKRYVAAMGGSAKVMALARRSFDAGDYAWAAELLNHLVFAGPNTHAKSLLQRCYEQLGYQSENSLWRNMYLTAAEELETGPTPLPTGQSNPLALAVTTPELFDLLAVRLDGMKAADADLKLEFVFPDRDEKTYVTVRNGVLIHRPIAAPGAVDATLTIRRSDLMGSLLGGNPVALKLASGEAKLEGQPDALARFAALLSKPTLAFPIVTPPQH
jgi:alkyl sulfatase BDS1-like metallo-beta-lactamase superfamily hydrolase